MESNTLEIRRLIDTIFSLQWCRENIVIPLGIEKNTTNENQRLTVAAGGALSGNHWRFYKTTSRNAGFECQFIEKPAHEIQAFLDQTTKNA